MVSERRHRRSIWIMSRSRVDFEDEPDVEAPPVLKKAKLDSDRFGHGDGDGNRIRNDHIGSGDGYGDAEVHDGCTVGDEPSNVGIDLPGDARRDRHGEVDDWRDVKTKKRSKPWKVHARPGGGSMHDANIYRHYRPDFRELASAYPDTFGPHVTQDPETGRATIDWKRPESMKELTRVMLKHDFGIEWDVPLDRLCPPVPNRLNYICWLSDLMKLRRSAPTGGDSSAGRGEGSSVDGMNSDAERNLLLFGTADGPGGMEDEEMDQDEWENGEEATAVVDENGGGGKEQLGRPPRGERCMGIDIGTGASCIYPLLGVKVAPRWSFIATDTDAVSAEWAAKNVRSNGLQDRIEVRLVAPSDIAKGTGPGPLLNALKDGDAEYLDFCMANPPFFASEDEAGQNPDTATAEMAAASEVACPGGEEAFVRAIIRDSLRLKEKVRWYTTMIGKKTNAKKLLRVLREAGVKNMRTTEFFQGRTVRWGLAWSFTTEGMVKDKVPDSPSLKVFSKKKVAERAQHSLRSFPVPLRPSGADAAGPQATAAQVLGDPLVKVTVSENLPLDVDDVVKRLRRSLQEFRQADITMDEINESSDPAYGYYSARSYSSATTTADTNTDNAQTIPVVGGAPTSSRSVTSAENALRGFGNPHAVRRFRCVAHSPRAVAAPSPAAGLTDTPLLAFDLNVNGAASWLGAAAGTGATGADGASIRVWARLEEGGDRGVFQRVWEGLQHDVFRQNRRWRREMSRSGGKGRGAPLAVARSS